MGMGLTINHHVEAAITIFGMVFDLLGALYLAYGLLGGQQGLLRTLTEMITYGFAGMLLGAVGFAVAFTIAMQFHYQMLVVLGLSGTFTFGIGYALAAGLGSGTGYVLGVAGSVPRSASSAGKVQRQPTELRVIAGIVLGLAVGLAQWFVAYLIVDVPTVHMRVVHRPYSSVAIGVGLGLLTGLLFAVTGGRLLRVFAQEPSMKPTFDAAGLAVGVAFGLVLGAVTSVGYGRVFGPDVLSPMLAGLAIGLVGGLGFGVLIGWAPYIDWWVDHLPKRRLGVTGTVLLLLGFAVQSIQYWLILLDIPVR